MNFFEVDLEIALSLEGVATFAAYMVLDVVVNCSDVFLQSRFGDCYSWTLFTLELLDLPSLVHLIYVTFQVVLAC